MNTTVLFLSLSVLSSAGEGADCTTDPCDTGLMCVTGICYPAPPEPANDAAREAPSNAAEDAPDADIVTAPPPREDPPPAPVRQAPEPAADAEPSAGAKNGACYGNRTCDAGLACKRDRCAEVDLTGTEGKACFPNGTCHDKLRCSNSSVCRRPPKAKRSEEQSDDGQARPDDAKPSPKRARKAAKGPTKKERQEIRTYIDEYDDASSSAATWGTLKNLSLLCSGCCLSPAATTAFVVGGISAQSTPEAAGGGFLFGSICCASSLTVLAAAAGFWWVESLYNSDVGDAAERLERVYSIDAAEALKRRKDGLDETRRDFDDEDEYYDY